MIVDWMNGHAKMKPRIGAIERAQKPPTGVVGSRVALPTGNLRLGHAHLSRTQQRS